MTLTIALMLIAGGCVGGYLIADAHSDQRAGRAQ
jgi:hypothetical protein